MRDPIVQALVEWAHEVLALQHSKPEYRRLATAVVQAEHAAKVAAASQPPSTEEAAPKEDARRLTATPGAVDLLTTAYEVQWRPRGSDTWEGGSAGVYREDAVDGVVEEYAANGHETRVLPIRYVGASEDAREHTDRTTIWRAPEEGIDSVPVYIGTPGPDREAGLKPPLDDPCRHYRRHCVWFAPGKPWVCSDCGTGIGTPDDFRREAAIRRDERERGVRIAEEVLDGVMQSSGVTTYETIKDRLRSRITEEAPDA